MTDMHRKTTQKREDGIYSLSEKINRTKYLYVNWISHIAFWKEITSIFFMVFHNLKFRTY